MYVVPRCARLFVLRCAPVAVQPIGWQGLRCAGTITLVIYVVATPGVAVIFCGAALPVYLVVRRVYGYDVTAV